MNTAEARPPQEPPGSHVSPARRNYALLAQGAIGVAGFLVIIGAFGSWGALSAVDEQAEIVKTTRIGIAVMGTLTIAAAAVPRFRPQAAAFAAVVFLVAAVLTYGEWIYEETQSFRYNASASRWGMVAIVAGATLGMVAAFVEIIVRRSGRTPHQPET